MKLDKAFNVSFVCDYMVVQTRFEFPDYHDNVSDEEIAEYASKGILDNYGINPLELCYDYEINEV